jgi:hypothetical protein
MFKGDGKVINSWQKKAGKEYCGFDHPFKDGSVRNAPPDKEDANPFIAGLMPTGAIIKCPVIAQPKNL